MLTIFLINLIPLVLATPSRQQEKRLNNGVGTKPALGFNNWNAKIASSAETALMTAEYFVGLGLQEVGYEYINIDDGWSERTRDANGNLQPNATLWPYGVANVSAQIHDMGLKFGMYGDSGTMTCAGYTGTYGYWAQDADLLASWGVDFWKFDYCNTNNLLNASYFYTPMRDALEATGRDIYFALCTWGAWYPWDWGASTGNSWRIHDDVSATWSSIAAVAATAQNIFGYASPGGFNDLDMLEVGNGALTLSEQQTHFTLWAIAKSPLLIGTDLSKINLASLSDLIAINQDPLGIAAAPVQPSGASPIDYSTLYPYWVGKLVDGYVVAMIAVDDSAELSVNFADVLRSGSEDLTSSIFIWKNLWTGEIGCGDSVTASLESHAVAVYKVIAISGF